MGVDLPDVQCWKQIRQHLKGHRYKTDDDKEMAVRQYLEVLNKLCFWTLSIVWCLKKKTKLRN